MAKANNSVSVQNSAPKELKELIDATAKLWRKYHLTYDQAGYVGKEAESAASAAGGGEHSEGHSEYHPPAPYRTTFSGQKVPSDPGPGEDPGFMSVHLNTLISTWIVMAILIMP